MIKDLFNSQIDYIFFFYGFALFLIGVMGYVLYNELKSSFWIFLGLFAFFHGMSKWVNMLGFSLGNNLTIEFLEVFLLILSYIFLMEFGRNGMSEITAKSPGRWIFIPLFSVALSGMFSGYEGINISFCYIFGISGGLWSAINLFYLSKKQNSKYLLSLSFILFLYSLTTGIFVRKGSFFPSSVLNQEFFYSTAGIPLQLFQAVLAVLMSVIMWIYLNKLRQQEPVWAANSRVISLYSKLMVIILMFILIFGWFSTFLIGKYSEKQLKEFLLFNTNTVVATINEDYVKKLKGTKEDIYLTEYKYLKSELMEIKDLNRDCNSAYLMCLKNGKIVFLVDSESVSSKDYSPPGMIYDDYPPGLMNVFLKSEALVEGPVADRWGTWYSGFSPVLDYNESKIIAVIGMDIAESKWKKIIARDRLDPILITLLLCILVIVFSIIHRMSLSASIKISATQKEKIESELKIAKNIQMTMVPSKFPPFPDRKEFDIYASMEPARVVGGDLYDFFMINDNELFFIIGDVSDKGVPASLFMMVTSTLLKTGALHGGPPSAIVEGVNKELCKSNDTFMFVTAFAGILNIKTGLLTYSNAGHNSPYIIRKGSVLLLEETHNCVLAIDEDVKYNDKMFHMKQGDYFFTFTDGVTEAMNSSDELFGEKRLEEKLCEKDYSSPEEIIKDVNKAIKSFVGDFEQSDDITMLSIRYNG